MFCCGGKYIYPSTLLKYSHSELLVLEYFNFILHVIILLHYIYLVLTVTIDFADKAYNEHIKYNTLLQ